MAAPRDTWHADDGAPTGPSFDVTIPSSRKGHGPYRVRRLGGTIRHDPPCEAFRWGTPLCTHVRQALALGEQPEKAAIVALRAALVVEMEGGTHRCWEHGHEITFRAVVQRAVEAAERQRESIEGEAAEAEHEAGIRRILTPQELAEDAFARFGS